MNGDADTGHNIEYPSSDQQQQQETILENSSSVSSSANSNNNAHVGTISKMFTQELTIVADRDPLHDLTVQVRLL